MSNKNNAISALISIFIFLSWSCNSPDSAFEYIYGKYKIFSTDPAMQRFTQGEKTYLEIKKDQTILYSSTINNKPKFNFNGTFTFDKYTNTLTIKWSEGKLPAILKIEAADKGHLIKIGETQYKKETK